MRESKDQTPRKVHKKKVRRVKFEDVLAMYKLIKDLYGGYDLLKERIKELEITMKCFEVARGQDLLEERIKKLEEWKKKREEN